LVCQNKLPTLKVGDTVLNESLGACLYFEVFHIYQFLIFFITLIYRFLKDNYKNQGAVLLPNEHKILILQRAFEVFFLKSFIYFQIS